MSYLIIIKKLKIQKRKKKEVTLDRDVTHLLVRVGAGGTKLTASHRVDNCHEWKLILNQAGLPCATKDELKAIVICPRHRRKFTRLRDQSGPCQHPCHQGAKTKLTKPKKVTTFQTEYFRSSALCYLSHPISILGESEFKHVHRT